jgi:DNA-binding transcriptional MerR regulator
VEKSPDAFRTISEAADELDLPQHVLRFWETRFSTIKPLKRGGGRRYYRPEDVLLLKGIRHLLYDQGFTIKGVQKILKDQGARAVAAIGSGGTLEALPPPSERVESEEPHLTASVNGSAPDEPPPFRASPALQDNARERLNAVLRDLLECKRLLERARE